MRQRFGVSVYKEAFNFCSAHFLIFADGSREELHGHNYRVSVEVDGPITDGDIVIDFVVLKPLVKAVCDSLDHKTLLPSQNQYIRVEEKDDMVWAHCDDGRFAFPARDVLILPIPNTSTERLAELICARLRGALVDRLPNAVIERIRVSVEETSGQCGYYEEQE